MSDMTRREFAALVGGVGLLFAVKVRRARAQQQEKMPRIGIIDDAPMWQPFRQALRELGYVEGQNIAYEYRYGEGAPDRLATVAAELVRRPVDLIATYGTPATYAAKEATATIPIVMIGVGDPVRSGLVASLARPGGNITGNTVLSPELGPKRLQILREVIANVTRVVYLANPDNASNVAALAETKMAASAAGTVLIPVEVREIGGLPAFEDAIHLGPGLPPLDQIVAAIGDQAAVGREKSIRVDGRQPVSCRERNNEFRTGCCVPRSSPVPAFPCEMPLGAPVPARRRRRQSARQPAVSARPAARVSRAAKPPRRRAA